MYEEKLAPYGFRKIKGRHPYFARVMGDEILQVVSYMHDRLTQWPYKEFEVVWGVATVYRPKINLAVSPLDTSWVRNNVPSGQRYPEFIYKDESLVKSKVSDADGEHGKELLEELEKSAESFIQNILPQLDQMKNIKECMDVMVPYRFAEDVCDYDCEHNKDEEEEDGIQNYKLYTLEEYEARRHNVEGWFDGQYREGLEQYTQELLPIFRKFTEDEAYKRKVLEEIERRKVLNQEILRSYGFEI